MQGDAILAAIDRIHSRSFFNPRSGDQELSLCIANSVRAFPESAPARRSLELAHGPALLRLAQDNLDTRPVLIKPLLILVGHIWQIPGFIPETGFVNFSLKRISQLYSDSLSITKANQRYRITHPKCLFRHMSLLSLLLCHR